jgi:hypothetical protein
MAVECGVMKGETPRRPGRNACSRIEQWTSQERGLHLREPVPVEGFGSAATARGLQERAARVFAPTAAVACGMPAGRRA